MGEGTLIAEATGNDKRPDVISWKPLTLGIPIVVEPPDRSTLNLDVWHWFKFGPLLHRENLGHFELPSNSVRLGANPHEELGISEHEIG